MFWCVRLQNKKFGAIVHNCKDGVYLTEISPDGLIGTALKEEASKYGCVLLKVGCIKVQTKEDLEAIGHRIEAILNDGKAHNTLAYFMPQKLEEIELELCYIEELDTEECLHCYVSHAGQIHSNITTYPKKDSGHLTRE